MTMWVRSLATVIVAALLWVVPSAFPAQTAPAPKGDAVKGRTLYKSDGCYQCHANEAQGGATGPRIGPDPLPFARFVAYCRAPRGEMPPYTAKVMSDQDLADVYAFLQTRPRPPAVRAIPLLAR